MFVYANDQAVITKFRIKRNLRHIKLNMNIEVCFSPQSYQLFHKPESVVVVIDILRASSAITTGDRKSVV